LPKASENATILERWLYRNS